MREATFRVLFGFAAAAVVGFFSVVVFDAIVNESGDERKQRVCAERGGVVLPESRGWRCALPGEKR